MSLKSKMQNKINPKNPKAKKTPNKIPQKNNQQSTNGNKGAQNLTQRNQTKQQQQKRLNTKTPDTSPHQTEAAAVKLQVQTTAMQN